MIIPETSPIIILKTPAEIQTGLDRQSWAEVLILQLPKHHDGRNSWLLNYGVSGEAEQFRKEHPSKPVWSYEHRAVA